MKQIPILYKLIPVWLLLLFSGLSACDYIHEDLEPCPHYLRFSYTYNMKQADAFIPEMSNQERTNQVRLYIFDDKGVYVKSEHYTGELLQANLFPIDLVPGNYRLLAWAGLNEADYVWEEPKEGTTLEQFRMSVKAGFQNEINRELLGLFRGELALEIPADKPSEHVVPMVKNTNKIRFVFIDTNSGTELKPESFAVKVTTDNGDLDYANQPVSATTMTWLPYYQAVEKVKKGEDAAAFYAVCAELNTMRLIDGSNGRLQIRFAGEAEPFLQVNLTDFLLLTKMESHQMKAQEYLDRQDEYVVMVYVDTMGGKAHCLEVIVNDWVIRLDDLTLGGKEEL